MSSKKPRTLKNKSPQKLEPQELDLIRDGIAVVPCEVDFDLDRFQRTLPEFVTCQTGDIATPLAWGGFGAMGTPSSFHHPLIRHLRRQCYEQMFPRVLLLPFAVIMIG